MKMKILRKLNNSESLEIFQKTFMIKFISGKLQAHWVQTATLLWTSFTTYLFRIYSESSAQFVQKVTFESLMDFK